MADDQLTLRLRLQDAARFQRDALMSGGAVHTFGDEVQVAGKKTEFARVETFAWRQGLFTLRRELYGATVALGLVGGGALKMGYDFDQAKAKGTSAMTGILGGITPARKEMAILVGLSESSGLSLTQLTDGAERLMEFGASAKEANAQLAAMSRFANVRNLGSGGVSSLIGIFNQIQTKGFLDSRSLRSLTSLGVNAQKILADNLPGGLTRQQVAQLQAGKLLIPTQYALPALTAGLAKTPGSAGIGGLLGQVRSTAAALFGELDKRAISWAQGFLPKVRGTLQAAITGLKTGGVKGMLAALDPSGTLANAWVVVSRSIVAVVSVIRAGRPVFVALGVILGALASVLAVVAHHGTLLKTVVVLLTLRYIYLRSVTLLTMAAQGLLGESMVGLMGWTSKTAASTKLLTMWQERSTLAGLTAIRMQKGLALVLRLTGLSALATGAEMAAAWIIGLGPIAWIIAAVAVLVGIVVYLGFRWKWFHNVLVVIWNWAKGHWPLLLEILAAPFTGGLSLILTHIGLIKNAIGAAFHWIEHQATRLFNWLGGLLRKIPGYGLVAGALHLTGSVFGAGAGLVGLADGGTVMSAGQVLVGERGPELLSLPRAARVTPLDHSSVSTSLLNHIRISVEPADVTMDGKKVGDAVFSARTTVGARK